MAKYVNKKFDFTTKAGRDYVENNYEEFAELAHNHSCGEELFLHHLLDRVVFDFFEARDLMSESDTYYKGLELMRDTLEFMSSDICENLQYCLGRQGSLIPQNLLKSYCIADIEEELEDYEAAYEAA